MGISGDMGLRRAVIIIFIIALLPLSILEVKADSNIGYQELVEVEVNSADTVEMENARYNRPDSISVISGDSVGALFQDSVPVMITDSVYNSLSSASIHGLTIPCLYLPRDTTTKKNPYNCSSPDHCP